MKRYLIACLVAASGSLAIVDSAWAADAEALAKKNQCMTCHAVDRKLVGPGYQEIARKYSGDKGAAAKLVEKVKKGGSGVWGQMPMPANPTVSDGDAKALVQWILAMDQK